MMISVVVPSYSVVAVSAVMVSVSSSAASSAAPSSVAPALEGLLIDVRCLLVSWGWRKWKVVRGNSVGDIRLLWSVERIPHLNHCLIALLHADNLLPLREVLLLSLLLLLAPLWKCLSRTRCCCCCCCCRCCCVVVGGSSVVF